MAKEETDMNIAILSDYWYNKKSSNGSCLILKEVKTGMMLRSIEAVIRMLDADYIEYGDLTRQLSGVCIDSRKVSYGNLYIPVIGERFDGHTFASQAIERGALAILWQKDHPNPPRNTAVILVEDTKQALCRLAQKYRESLDLVMIGVTGSNGKTSTKDMLCSVLKRRYVTQKTQGNRNNEIGVPLTLLGLSEATRVAIVEMGMENRGEIDMLTRMVQPDIAIITNIGEAHLENLGSLANIAKAKAEIVHGLKENGVLLYYGEQDLLKQALWNEELPAGTKVKSFGNDERQDLYWYGTIRQDGEGIVFHTNLLEQPARMNVYGKHQVLNALPAIYAARALGMEEADILEGLADIEKTAMRSDLVRINKGWILDDSYKSNRQSVLAALDTLEQFDVPRRIAVLSDMLDMGEQAVRIHYETGKAVAAHAIDKLYTYGEMSRYIAQGAFNNGLQEVAHFETKEALIEELQVEFAQPCVVLVKGSRGMQMDTIVTWFKEREKGSVRNE